MHWLAANLSLPGLAIVRIGCPVSLADRMSTTGGQLQNGRRRQPNKMTDFMNPMKKRGQTFALVLLALVLGGCASTNDGQRTDSGTNINGYISTGASKKL